MKPEKINYPEICREIEKRVQKDAPRTHRLPLTKSSFAVNRVAKVYRSEVQELLKKCSKLDRMLIQRINPEAETQSDSTQSIDEIMSGLKSSRTESNDSEESASEESLARTRSRANTEESKSSNNTFPPNVEYSDDKMYKETPTMEASFETNSSNDKKSSRVENSSNETSSRRNTSGLRGYKKDNRSYFKVITSDNNLQPEVSSNSELENSSMEVESALENSHLEVSKEKKMTRDFTKLHNSTFSQRSSTKIDLSNLNDVTINDEEFSTESNPGINNDAGSRSTTKGITETASKVTKRTKRKSGSRKRTKTSLRTIGTQTAEDPQACHFPVRKIESNAENESTYLPTYVTSILRT
ncbi:uncharacterized protein LOC110997085 isoform X2 [Pieris rapae]|uniref:uncharacterized protein LOC110997085 isoform X2 n=1 Tax=Pieris rapae TaxID=64459 RepID=UPI001E281848|nr:uncharacterized protein LOC110997085 isoform X2 [Pieris rapae]